MTEAERKLLLHIANCAVLSSPLQANRAFELINAVRAERHTVGAPDCALCLGDHALCQLQSQRCPMETARVVQAETVGIDEDKFEAQCQAVRFDTLLVEHTHKLDGQSVFGLVNTIAGQRQTIALSIDDTLRLHAWLGVQLRKLGEL